jgi:hypothetical protein
MGRVGRLVGSHQRLRSLKHFPLYKIEFKMKLREASPPVEPMEARELNKFIVVIFFRPMSHFVRYYSVYS